MLFEVAGYKYIPTNLRIILFLGSLDYPSHMKGYARDKEVFEEYIKSTVSNTVKH